MELVVATQLTQTGASMLLESEIAQMYFALAHEEIFRSLAVISVKIGMLSLLVLHVICPHARYVSTSYRTYVDAVVSTVGKTLAAVMSLLIVPQVASAISPTAL